MSHSPLPFATEMITRIRVTGSPRLMSECYQITEVFGYYWIAEVYFQNGSEAHISFDLWEEAMKYAWSLIDQQRRWAWSLSPVGGEVRGTRIFE